MLDGKVLITGGAGFIGRAIMRRAQRENWPTQFTVVSRSEQLQAQCKRKYPNATYVLGDVCDTNRLALAMVGHDYVIHAAALKFIPEGEFNASEVVRVNIDGARSVIMCAQIAGVDMVGISTDKAAAPVNIYGATKMVMERLFAEAGFNTVRYGNVLGSTGSVVPVMRDQLEKFGYVNLTDPNMTRFWMTADMAVSTILAGFDAAIGTITVPQPASATMHSVAHAIVGNPVCHWDDVTGCGDDRIHVVGTRPGEKLHEDLVTQYEMARTKRDDKWWRIFPPGSEAPGASAAALSSLDSPRYSHDELVAMIEDAQAI